MTVMPNHYLELILYKTYADLKAETERTYLGFLWWVFEPVMYMAVFYVVFGVLMGRGTDDYVPFLLIGLTVWQWLRAAIMHGANTILGGRPLMQQVHLPKVIFPSVLILTDTVKFFFIFTLLLVFLWFSGYPPGITYLALPVLLLVQFLLLSALSYLMAAIVPFLPDLRFVVDNLLHAVFFLSGIFFAADKIPAAYHGYFYLNPMANLIEDYRRVLMHNQWPDWSTLGLIGVLSLFGVLLAIGLIRRFEYVYPRINA